jgi:hypothetical protein
MRKITPALALRATEAVDSENKLGIQIGEPVGHSRPPRVYLSFFEFPNAGITGVVTKIMESGGIDEAREIPDSEYKRKSEEKVIEKAAEYTQDFLEGFNPDNGGTLFLAGNREMADNVVSQINILNHITVKINEGEPEYIPEPTS